MHNRSGVQKNNNNHNGTHKNKTGILSKILSHLKRNRLGELLIVKGILTPAQLRRALSLQKTMNVPLGQVLIQENMMTARQLRLVLVRQSTLRTLTALLLFVLTFSGFSQRKAVAELPDTAAKISLSASDHFSKVSYYPGLFGADEERSTNLKPFTKWTGMFEQFERDLTSSSKRRILSEWADGLSRFSGMDLRRMAASVNRHVNEQPYILDNKLWGKSDYWATPAEFLQRGGDCEDFAIAKYTALRILGVPEERLRIAIVQDQVKDIPHAVLVVYTDNGAVVLDNQNEDLVDGSRLKRYKPIFSINRQAWWLHTVPDATVLASAR